MRKSELITLLSNLPEQEVYLSTGSGKMPVIVVREGKEHFIPNSGEEPEECSFILISSSDKHRIEFK